jgi:hypothetical protein
MSDTSPVTNELCYSLAVEKLLQLRFPVRADCLSHETSSLLAAYSAQKRSEASGLPFQCLASAALRIVINYIEDFDSTIRRARCKALDVVIQLRVVLGKVSVSILTCE